MAKNFRKVIVLVILIGVFLAACENTDKSNSEGPDKKEQEQNKDENNEEKKKKVTVTEVDSDDEDSDEPIKENDNDTEQSESQKITTFSFSEPRQLNNAMDEDAVYSVFEGASKENLLFISGGGTLYMYNIEEQRRFVIDQKVKKAIITKDNSFVFYTKENNGKDVIFQYDIELEFPYGPFLFPEDAASVEQMVYHKGVLMYSYASLNEEGKIHTRLGVEPSHLSDLPSFYNHTIYTESSFHTTVDDNGMFFGYNPVEHAFQYYSVYGDQQTIEPVSDSIPKDSILHYSLSKGDGKNSLLIYYSIEDRGGPPQPLVINGEIVEDFEIVSQAQWISDDTVLVGVDDGLHIGLYLYNINEKVPQLIQEDVNWFFTTGDSVFFNSVFNQVYQIDITKKEG